MDKPMKSKPIEVPAEKLAAAISRHFAEELLNQPKPADKEVVNK